jgi:hypothetical protein
MVRDIIRIYLPIFQKRNWIITKVVQEISDSVILNVKPSPSKYLQPNLFNDHT